MGMLSPPQTSAAPFATTDITEADIQQELARFAPECHPPGPESQRTAAIVAAVCISFSVALVGWMGAMVGGAPMAMALVLVGIFAGIVRALPTLYVVSLRRRDRALARMRVQARRARLLTRHA